MENPQKCSLQFWPFASMFFFFSKKKKPAGYQTETDFLRRGVLTSAHLFTWPLQLVLHSTAL